MVGLQPPTASGSWASFAGGRQALGSFARCSLGLVVSTHNPVVIGGVFAPVAVGGLAASVGAVKL